jgi:hypothetical protein
MDRDGPSKSRWLGYFVDKEGGAIWYTVGAIYLTDTYCDYYMWEVMNGTAEAWTLPRSPVGRGSDAIHNFYVLLYVLRITTNLYACIVRLIGIPVTLGKRALCSCVLCLNVLYLILYSAVPPLVQVW